MSGRPGEAGQVPAQPNFPSAWEDPEGRMVCRKHGEEYARELGFESVAAHNASWESDEDGTPWDESVEVEDGTVFRWQDAEQCELCRLQDAEG